MIHDRADAERLIAILETMPPDDWQGEFHRDLAEILRALLASLPAPAAPEEEKYHREVDVSLKNTAKEGSRDERCTCGRPRLLHVVGGDGETYTCDGYIWPR